MMTKVNAHPRKHDDRVLISNSCFCMLASYIGLIDSRLSIEPAQIIQIRYANTSAAFIIDQEFP